MIRIGDKELINRFITDSNGVPHKVISTFVDNKMIYNPEHVIYNDTNAEFYKRQTANGAIENTDKLKSAIKEVRGKSIVWNQLLKINKVGTEIVNGVTFIKNSDGTIVANGTATSSTYYNSQLFGTTYITAGHKYLLRGNHNDGSYETYVVADSNGSIEDVNGKGEIRTINNNKVYISIVIKKDIAVNNIVFRPVFFDLTLMFGAGNEPATVEEFEKMFPLDYYDYNAGEVIPFAGQNLVTTGKNQYNPATGKANLLGGQTYQLLGTYTGATIDEVAVTLDSNNCFTTTKDCVLEIAGGNDTDTFVGLYNGETNTYEPYEKHTLPLDPSQWRDKDGNLVFPYGGMHGVGTAYDYAKVDADGYIRKAVRCFGQVDLGSTDYILNESRFESKGGVNGTQSFYNKPNFICPKYMIVRTVNNTIDKALGGYFPPRIAIFDSAYTDATELKKSLQGVPLYYELAEPVEVELATPVYAKYLVDKDGTEEITPANGATPYTTMATMNLIYSKRKNQ